MILAQRERISPINEYRRDDRDPRGNPLGNTRRGNGGWSANSVRSFVMLRWYSGNELKAGARLEDRPMTVLRAGDKLFRNARSKEIREFPVPPPVFTGLGYP